MCTLTVWPEGPGYRLAMNRDEQRSRLPALPPFLCSRNGCRVLAPLDPAGGTWIAANDSGVTFALLNGYQMKGSPSGEPTSRGTVVISLSTSTTISQAVDRLGVLQLRKVRPFRLVGCFARERTILEWRWDLHRLSALEASLGTRPLGIVRLRRVSSRTGTACPLLRTSAPLRCGQFELASGTPSSPRLRGRAIVDLHASHRRCVRKLHRGLLPTWPDWADVCIWAALPHLEPWQGAAKPQKSTFRNIRGAPSIPSL
jgi:hypothetical protein